ncbi:MAG: dTMP kinase [Halioglobus sp.]
MNKRGLFITVEGGEGVGKSTGVNLLRDFLSRNGVDIVTTREPGGTKIGEEIRDLLLRNRQENVSAITELLLIFAARAQHIHDVIEPALAAGSWVLCDRFTDATYAYQCGGRGVSTEIVRGLEEMVQRELRPDYTLLLDGPVQIGMSRARNRGELDRIEQETLEFFERVRMNYLEQATNSGGRYRVVDASLSLNEVEVEILRFGGELLTCWTQRLAGSWRN